MKRRRERGQSTVEFALVIPLVLVAVLAVIQVSAIAYAQLAVTHSAREAARVLAVDPAADLTAVTGGTGPRFAVSFVSSPGSQPPRQWVRVVATQDIDPITPLFGRLVDGFMVQAEAQMLAE